MSKKINIALLWHMHQPYYRNPYSRKIELPWARLHGLKDYWGMVALLEDFPWIKATFNLVPSLLTQLESYCRGEKDLFQEIFLKEAQSLKVEEIHFLVRHFFSANPRNLIQPWPRYWSLYEKKNRSQHSNDHPPWEKVFSVDELRDLQVWFQLCYFDERYQKDDQRLKELIKKGQKFSEQDKKTVAEAERELLSAIIPLYKKIADSGQIELSTTPFYHPILPLLIDPQEGRRTNPNLPEYDLHFNWTADAIFQLQAALDYMQETFGKRPVGIWPSEGGLSMAVLQILTDLGIQWTATDELNLSHSLGMPIERDQHFNLKVPEILYRPYRVQGPLKKTAIFFRDRHLSDLIGFHYREMPYKKAAANLVQRVKFAGSRYSGQHDLVIPIILDGENAWEYYPNSGRDFLKEVFQLIKEDETLETVTFSQALALNTSPGELTRLSSGSWVNGNFDIWIGDEEDRKGWELVVKTKKAIEIEHAKSSLSPQRRGEIEQFISIAQGSDWFWWYGKENYTQDLDLFDNLFRKNLQKVYDLLGIDSPVEFSLPIPGGSRKTGITVIPPSRSLHPWINGQVNSFFEWYFAGCIDVSRSGGAMNIANPLVDTLYYGFDDHFFYLRVDTRGKAVSYFEEGYSLTIVIRIEDKRLRLPVQPAGIHDNAAFPGVETAIAAIIEIGIPLQGVGLQEGTIFYLQLDWKYKGEYFQVIPAHDYFRLVVPRDKDYAHFWIV